MLIKSIEIATWISNIQHLVKWFENDYDTALYAEQILNKIAKTFDGTYAGLKSMLQRFRIYFFRNPAMKGMESTS